MLKCIFPSRELFPFHYVPPHTPVIIINNTCYSMVRNDRVLSIDITSYPPPPTPPLSGFFVWGPPAYLYVNYPGASGVVQSGSPGFNIASPAPPKRQANCFPLYLPQFSFSSRCLHRDFKGYLQSFGKL